MVRTVRLEMVITDEALAFARDVLGLDLGAEIVSNPQELAERVACDYDDHPRFIARAVWLACREQAEAAGLTRDQFYSLLAHPLAHAKAAFAYLSALAVRFPETLGAAEMVDPSATLILPILHPCVPVVGRRW